MSSARREELAGKTAVVTGASSGMGRGIAIAFSAAGADVVFTGRDRPRLEAAAAEARGNTHILSLDLNAPDAPGTLVAETITAFGCLDLLVHAAGVFLPKPFAQSTLADLDRQWETNVRAPYAITKAALPHLQAGAVVIFISSIAGLVGFPNAAGYCATKGAVELMSKALALEFASSGIRFNCIAPGNIRTPMNDHLFADPAYAQAMLASTPSGRIGTVEDVSATAVFMASDGARYMHGASIVVDGGWTVG
jgi:NAD(P)-dependent dehydrogenase (short-subunit alcohol dehydrogenase family)